MELDELMAVALGLGLRHAADADHLAAVSTLIVRRHASKRNEVSGEKEQGGPGWESALLGASWGAGHLLTILIAGGSIILLEAEIPAGITRVLELGVAGLLVALGASTLRRGWHGKYHFHWHHHDWRRHPHLHFHPAGEAGSTGHYGVAAVGMAHGLAGTAGVAVLVVSTIPSKAAGIAYLGVFGAGALLGMTLFSAAVGTPLARAGMNSSGPPWLRLATAVAGASSVAVGIMMAMERAL